MSDTQLGTPIKIRAETSIADPNSCKFTVDRTVHAGGPFASDGHDPTKTSPLFVRLFALGDISHVLVGGATVTVTKSPAGSWDALRRSIGAEIRAQLASGIPSIVEPRGSSTVFPRTDAQTRAAIEDLLSREVNPSIAVHGGKISVVDFTDGILSIIRSGGCQGCASSTATLRNGFETKARLVAPEIIELIDVTDHAAGASPFYPADSLPSSQPGPLDHATGH